MSDIENEFFYDPRTGRVAGDALAGDADGLVERVAQRLLEDAAYIENYSGFVGNPDYIAGNQREAAAAITQLRERAKHWEHEALCLGEFAATYNRDAELQNLMSLNNDLLERLATVERERDALKQGEPDAATALDALALRWAVKSWMTKDFPQQECEDFKHDVLATYVSLARPYLNRAEAAERERDEALEELGKVIMACPMRPDMRMSPASQGVRNLRTAFEAAEAKVLALTTALTEATIKVENDRTLWNTEWQQWLHLARAALERAKPAAALSLDKGA